MTAVTVPDVQITQVDYLHLCPAGPRPLGNLRNQNLGIPALPRTPNNGKDVSHTDMVSIRRRPVKEVAAYRARYTTIPINAEITARQTLMAPARTQVYRLFSLLTTYLR